MSSVLKPKEQQTAFERWEMASFSAEGKMSAPKKAAQELPELKQQLAQLAEKARKEGYAKGLTEGYTAGMQQAMEAMQADRQALAALTESLAQTLQKSDQEIAEHLLALALDLAKTMLKTHMTMDSTAVLPIVREAIQSLPYVQHPARVRVNPLDAAAVKHYLTDMADQPWQLIEDAHIERGGCQIETGANQVDASNTTRWKRIADMLAQDSRWETP